MEFENRAPEWKNEGKEPGEELKEKGFVAGYKPPASYFNWWWNRISRCIKEIINKLEGISKADVGLDQVDNTADKDKAVSDLTQTELDKKVDKIGGKDQLELDKVENKSSSEILEGMTKDNVVTALGCDPSQMGDVYVGVGKIANNATTTEEGFVTDARQLNREVSGSFAATVMEAIEQQTPTLPDNILSTDNIANNTTTTEEGFAVDARQLNATVPGSYAESVATSLAARAPLASPAFTGTPTAPTQSNADNSTKLATTAYVQNNLTAKAPLASPTFTGTPKSTTPAATDSSTRLATTAYVSNKLVTQSSNGLMLATDKEKVDYFFGDNNRHSGLRALVPNFDWARVRITSANSDVHYIDNPDSICYGNGLYVVGAQGTIHTSVDGIAWKEALLLGTAQSQSSGSASACYANGLFVVCTYDGRYIGEYETNKDCFIIVTSPDGITWTERYRYPDNSCFMSVCYGNGRFVASTFDGYLVVSKDGVTWEKHDRPDRNGRAYYEEHICFAKGWFYLILKGEAFKSTDGIAWVQYNTIGAFPKYSYRTVRYLNDNIFIALPDDGGVVVSKDGIIWDSVVNGFQGSFVDYGNGIYLV